MFNYAYVFLLQTTELEEIVHCLCNGRKPKEVYPEYVRSFCMAIHFYSPRTYDYIRAKFNNHLPHESTLRAWYSNSNIDAEPGINKTSLDMLREKADSMKENGKQLVCDIIFDEVSIRKHIQWNPKTRSFLGYVTYGFEGNPNVEDLPVATQAIVFMISGINEFFQIPVAYYFIHSLDAFDRQKLLLRVLKEVTEKTSARIANVTFDGYMSNATMCELLGANLNDDLKPSFKNPYSDNNEIQIMLDPSHAEKLIRSTLDSQQILYDGDNKLIKWKYFADLYNYSKENNFGMTHKITKRHIEFHTRKMCVRTAVELLSNSTANSLEFLMKNGVPEFADASATIKFVRIFDKLFDVMNTARIKPGSIFKSALNPTNKHEIFEFLNEAKEYILSLKIMSKSSNKLIPIVKSRLKTGFRGYIINIISVINLYNELVEKQKLMPFLATYRLSQDHLEMFFGKLRSMNGYNDNMTVQQFTSAYKKLLHRCDVRISSHSNISITGSSSNILTVSSRRVKLYDDLDGDVPLHTEHDAQTDENDLFTELDELEQLERNNYLIDQVNIAGIAFIANIIENRMLSVEYRDNISCSHCRQVLEQNEKIDTRICVKGTSCRSTFELCKLADRAIKTLLPSSSQSTFKQKVYMYVLSNLNIHRLYSNYFEHEGHDVDHKNYIIKHVIDEYTRIKCTYLAKIKTMDMQKVFLRNKFRKQIHVAGQ